MISGSFGKDGWIKFHFYRSKSNPVPERDFVITLHPKDKSQIISFEQAAKNVARDIHTNYTNIFIAMSGGIDSEYVAETFLKLGLPFTPIIFELENLNYLDVWHAHRWCHYNNIRPEIIKFNLKDYTNEVLKNLKEYHTRTPGGTAVLRIIRDYVRSKNGNLVTGGGDLEYYPDPTIFHASPFLFGYDKEIEDKNHNPTVEGFVLNEPDIIRSMMMPEMPFNFYSWTPEIVLSYVAVRDLDKNNEENKIDITGCYPRPKNMGIPEYIFNRDPDLSNIVVLRNYLGSSECNFMGSKQELIKQLL